ncbi:glycosyltransferase family 2 protein [Candidatus Saccharibacteria bacterium TM7i]|nr:glycosyltransferase family 2 protein [Candidatus Saccharibacteria bacterium TM7i]
MKLSVVIPAYNEAEGIETFHQDLLLPGVKNATKNYEIIYINDGSKDKTLELLTRIAKKDSNVKVVNLSRNFGKEIATTAGIFQASGDATIILDADGQHPPAIIDQFTAKWKKGAQVVIGVRNKQQHEGFIKEFGSKLFYKAFNGTSGEAMVPRSTDFRLISKEVREEFLKFAERNRITRGLIDWLGFKREYIIFDSPERLAGEASYKTSQLIKLATNSFVSLSLKPLFLFGWIGATITTISLIIGVFVALEQFILGDPLQLNFTGSALLGIFISFLVGIVLMSQGMIAVYLSHVHSQSQGRPLFVIDKSTSSNIQ